MSISTRLEAINQHLLDDYSVLELGGADLTNVDKNIFNLKPQWQDRLKYYLAHGVDVLWNNWEKVSGSGETLTLNNTMEGKMKVDLKGNTYQYSTTGKNLYKTPNSTTTNGITFTKNSDGTYNISGTATAKADCVIDGNINDFTNGNNYCMSATKSLPEGLVVYFEIYNNSTWIRQALGIGKYLNNTTQQLSGSFNGSNGNLVKFTLRVDNGTTLNIENLGIQLETGTTPTTWEEYTGNQPSPSPSYPQDIQVVSGDNSIKVANGDNTEYEEYPISLGNIELCKIGTYQDKIYKDNGKWYLNKQIGKTTVSSFASKSGTTRNNDYFTSAISGILRPSGGNILIPTYSNHFTQDTADNVYSYDRVGLGVNTNGTLAVGFGLSTSITTLELANQWITNNNILLYFPLATPTYTEITDTTLLSQLEARAYSYEGTTNISQVNDDMPFILDTTALKEMS